MDIHRGESRPSLGKEGIYNYIKDHKAKAMAVDLSKACFLYSEIDPTFTHCIYASTLI
jgi:hypothetical protein